MAFEHYTRSGTKMLRCGYTTGTCAALAAAAATRILLCGKAPETVSLMTGKGIPVEVAIEEFGREPAGTEDIATGLGPADETGLPQSAWAAVPKDAGDDADVTDGMLIRADVRRSQTPGITIDGGRGVGRVTKPGLDQPVGNAAINSGPRRMITDAVRQVLEELDPEGSEPGTGPQTAGCGSGIQVIISVPEGEAAAKKTFNPKLGIEGGISILGTTGIVEPMSEQALVDTIEVELKQICAGGKNGSSAGSTQLILTPGNYGSDYIAGHDLDSLGVPVLKFSNFLGETLDMIAASPIDTVLLVAHVGKLSKVAAGVMNTHSKYADGRNEIFCAHAAICGGSTSLCRNLMEAATTDACIQLLDEAGLREPVIGSILDAVQSKLEHRTAGSCRIGALMFSNVYGLLGMTEPGRQILGTWEEGQK
ncbi:MAG: cobalamin biosynthesis protein CbiD [Firmicutes bacterium]|nr:cobalamin biosynthesis protein CbiD [Bacillota bacterium]